MNTRTISRFSRLLCGLASVLLLGLLASPASAQNATATYNVGTYLSLTWDDDPHVYDFFVNPNHYVAGVATRIIGQPFTMTGNVPMTVTGQLVKPTRVSPAPTTAPGAWSIKLDGGPEIAFPGLGTVSKPAGVHPGQSATLKVVLTLADGGAGPSYEDGTLTLTIAPT